MTMKSWRRSKQSSKAASNQSNKHSSNQQQLDLSWVIRFRCRLVVNNSDKAYAWTGQCNEEQTWNYPRESDMFLNLVADDLHGATVVANVAKDVLLPECRQCRPKEGCTRWPGSRWGRGGHGGEAMQNWCLQHVMSFVYGC